MLLFRCALSSQLMKLSVTNVCICSWHLKWFLPEIMGFSQGRPADTLLWTWKWRVTCLLVLLGKWASKCLEQDYLGASHCSLCLYHPASQEKFTTKLMAEAFRRTDEALEIFEEQYPNNVRFASVFRCMWDVCGIQQRDLYERKEPLSSTSAGEVQPDDPMEWQSNGVLSVDV